MFIWIELSYQTISIFIWVAFLCIYKSSIVPVKWKERNAIPLELRQSATLSSFKNSLQILRDTPTLYCVYKSHLISLLWSVLYQLYIYVPQTNLGNIYTFYGGKLLLLSKIYHKFTCMYVRAIIWLDGSKYPFVVTYVKL